MLEQFLFGLFVAVLFSSSLAIIKDTYGKVHPEFPEDFMDIYLGTVPGKSHTVVQCGAICSNHRDCKVYCMENGSCKLFWAFVTSKWTGPAATGEAVAYKYQKCFSILGGPKEIMHNAIPSASSIFDLEHSENNAVNGYMSISKAYLFESSDSTNPWWSGELPVAYNISLIWLGIHPDYSNNIEVRFGLDSNIHNNAVIATTDNDFNDISALLPIEPPAYGLFLTIKRYTMNDFLVLGSECAFKV